MEELQNENAKCKSYLAMAISQIESQKKKVNDLQLNIKETEEANAKFRKGLESNKKSLNEKIEEQLKEIKNL